MHRMMQSSGTAEGLRGLIDMTLVRSIKKIVQYRGLFGPNILPLGDSYSTFRIEFIFTFLSHQYHVDLCSQ